MWIDATVADAPAEGLAVESIHPCDLTRAEDVARFVDHAGARYGRIDILLNAAAIAPHMAQITEIDYEKQWRTTIIGEVDVVVLAVKAAWPWLVKSGRGAIINFSSVSSSRASLNFGMGPHCAGKAAVEALTRQLGVEGGPHNIRANGCKPAIGMLIAKA
jgi:NAD(P)-dependent dehydrogenase (short-subunit alcohol dehydrogenase family)